MDRTPYYELTESPDHPGQWHVEAIGKGDEVYVAVFSGPGAWKRAVEYADWKNRKRAPTVLELIGRSVGSSSPLSDPMCDA